MIFDFQFDHDPARSALGVIDMQNNYVAGKQYGLPMYLEAQRPGSTDYYLGRVDGIVIPAIQALLDFFRSRGMPVVYFVNSIETEDASDWNPITREQMLKTEKATGIRRIFQVGTFEHEIAAAIAPQKRDLVVAKKAQDAFATSAIDRMLRNMGVQSLFLTGVVTEGCVESTARGAFNHGYQTVIVEDGCATIDPAAHDWALRIFASMCGEVKSSEHVIRTLGQ